MIRPYEAIVIGVSAGAVEALSCILPALPEDYPFPVIVVVHVPPDKESIIAALLAAKCKMKVCEANDKQPIIPGHIYFAPANYHLLVEYDGYLSLSNEDEVRYSRPSIDVLFESAADAFGENMIGIILTGANNDGAQGMAHIADYGGLCIVQSPSTSYADAMPSAALAASPNSKTMDLAEIAQFLQDIGTETMKRLAEEPARILVVDDDENSAQTISWMLEALGYAALIAHNGQEAIDIARKEKPQAILLDITLPDISGLDVCKILKSDPDFASTFIAAQTGWSDEKDRDKAFDHGVDDYLIKPVSMDSYAALLKGIRKRSKA